MQRFIYRPINNSKNVFPKVKNIDSYKRVHIKCLWYYTMIWLYWIILYLCYRYLKKWWHIYICKILSLVNTNVMKYFIKNEHWKLRQGYRWDFIIKLFIFFNISTRKIYFYYRLRYAPRFAAINKIKLSILYSSTESFTLFFSNIFADLTDALGEKKLTSAQFIVNCILLVLL